MAADGGGGVMVMVFNANFNNISVILSWSALLQSAPKPLALSPSLAKIDSS